MKELLLKQGVAKTLAGLILKPKHEKSLIIPAVQKTTF